MTEKNKDNLDEYHMVKEGIFEGVLYNITNAEVVEENGETMIKFDYDTKGLDDSDSEKFEEYIGQLIIEALKTELQKDMTDEEIEKLWH